MYENESNIFDEFFAMQHDSFETTGIKLFQNLDNSDIIPINNSRI